MKTLPEKVKLLLGCAILLPVIAVCYCIWSGSWSLWTSDQQGYRNFQQNNYQQAAEQFRDPIWQGVAWFERGDFKKAATLFANFDSPEAVFNHGNALVMQGLYQQAAERYQQALELRPGWQAATTNLEIALAREEMLKKTGEEMTGGQLAADDFTFSQNKSEPSAEQEQPQEQTQMSAAELRATWLRQVQTRPADFLRSKFAYQQARRQALEDKGGDK